MADKEFDPWATGSGLPDAFTGTIDDAYFTFDENYQNGENCVLKLEVNTGDAEMGEDGVLTLLFPCGGNAWEPKNKGASVEHESGKPKLFNSNSGVGLLMNAARECMGDDLVERGLPTEADTWKGLAFDWERKEFSGTFNGEKTTWNRVLPVAVAEGGAKPAASTAKKTTSATKKAASAKAAAAEGEAAGDDEGVKLPPKIKVALRKIAEANSDHDAFMEAAYDAVSEMDGWADEYESFITDDSGESIWGLANA